MVSNLLFTVITCDLLDCLVNLANGGKDWSLVEAICDVEVATVHFFNNSFDRCKNQLKPHAGVSIYHAWALSAAEFATSMFTMEKPLLAIATETAHQCEQLAVKMRKHSSLGKNLMGMFKTPNYDSYTDGKISFNLAVRSYVLRLTDRKLF